MATGDFITQVRSIDLVPDSGELIRIRAAGNLEGIPLAKSQGVSFLFEVPANGTPLATGLTFALQFADDPVSPQASGAIKVGITVVPITSGTTPDTDPAFTNEVLATVTLPATPGAVLVASVAVANAQLSSLAAGNHALVHIRRKGTDAADVHAGRPLLLGVIVKDT